MIEVVDEERGRASEVFGRLAEARLRAAIVVDALAERDGLTGEIESLHHVTG